ASTIERMVENFRTLLESASASANTRLGELAMLSEAELALQVDEWNGSRMPFPMDTCIHQVFEQQVDRIPDRVAVVCGESQWTYRELDAEADALAGRLCALGIGPEAVVGVCLPRSLSLCVAILAVLKAGAAYLPIEPSYPIDRLRYLVADAAPSVLL